MQRELEQFERRRVRLIAVSSDDAASLDRLVFQNRLEFPVLIDPGGQVIESYGLINPDKPGVTHPASLLIDRGRVVRAKRVDVNYRRRPPVPEIIGWLRDLDRSPPSAESAATQPTQSR